MNLREKFIWNLLLALGSLSIAWSGWTLYNINLSTNALFNNYKNEQVGTDEKLNNKVNELEDIYTHRHNMKFKSNSNPFDLTRVINSDLAFGRKSKLYIKDINFYAIQKTLKKIKDVDSAIIIIDSYLGIDRQDKRIIHLVSDHAKSLIIVFNKIDLIDNLFNFKKKQKIDINSNLHQVKNIKIFFISSFSKKQVLNIIDYIYKKILSNKLILNTSILNKWLKKCTQNKSHPLIDRKKVNFKYAVKIHNNPIIIKIFCNYSNKIKKDYIRYLVNNFKAQFKILNQNIKFIFSNTQNPYN